VLLFYFISRSTRSPTEQGWWPSSLSSPLWSSTAPQWETGARNAAKNWSRIVKYIVPHTTLLRVLWCYYQNSVTLIRSIKLQRSAIRLWNVWYTQRFDLSLWETDGRKNSQNYAAASICWRAIQIFFAAVIRSHFLLAKHIIIVQIVNIIYFALCKL